MRVVRQADEVAVELLHPAEQSARVLGRVRPAAAQRRLGVDADAAQEDGPAVVQSDDEVADLLLALGAACLHRYPFMANYGGNRLMLFSAPFLYLLTAAGGWVMFAWLWQRRQRWLALALTGVILVALHPRAGLREDLDPLNNREEIQPLVTYLEANLEPRDLVYVYYFAVSPFKYYYHGPNPGICWGRSCVEQGLEPAKGSQNPPQRLWLIASHLPPMDDMREFATDLLGPQWQETACYTEEGAILLRFDQGLAYEEIAAIVAAPESTVRSRVHHGLKELRRVLTQGGAP